jgi:hypothetical protein
LKRALDEVAWEIRVRDAVRAIVAAEGVRAVQSAVTLEQHAVGLRLIVVASPEQASALERRLETRIAAAAGVPPSVVVTAVPDAGALQTALARVTRNENARSAPRVDLGDAQRRVSLALQAAWPEPAAGPLVGWTLELAPNETAAAVTVRHIGVPLGRAAESMLARSLTTSLGTALRVVDVAFPPAPVNLEGQMADSTWLSIAVLVLEQVPRTDSLVACLQRPRADAGRVGRGRDAALDASIRASATARTGRLEWSQGSRWAIGVAVGSCRAPARATP